MTAWDMWLDRAELEAYRARAGVPTRPAFTPPPGEHPRDGARACGQCGAVSLHLFIGTQILEGDAGEHALHEMTLATCTACESTRAYDGIPRPDLDGSDLLWVTSRRGDHHARDTEPAPPIVAEGP